MWGSCSPVAQRLSWWFGLCIWIFEQIQGVGQLLLLEICGVSWILKAVDLMKLWLKSSGSCWTGQTIIVEQWQKQCTEVSDEFDKCTKAEWELWKALPHQDDGNKANIIKWKLWGRLLLLWSIVCWFSWCVMKYWGDVQRLKETWFLL